MIKINITKHDLYNLYIKENKTKDEIALQLNVSTSTISRYLKKFEIKKDNSLKGINISKTINNRTEEEKTAYSNAISASRKGKGIGIIPWNKGKHTGNGWTGKRHSEKSKQKISITKNTKSSEEKERIEAKRRASRIYGDPWNKGKHTGAWTEEQKSNILSKQYVTKKKNNSFNYSKPEDIYYNKLVEKYGIEDVERQYIIDSRYSFACDFYIKSLDLFIELNLSWTHGDHPFDSTNEDDLIKLKVWQEKAQSSDYYKNAIDTWTIRDVKKLQTAINNNLNYITYYSESELYDE